MSAIAGLLCLDHSAIDAEPAERMAARAGSRGCGAEEDSYRSPEGRAALAARGGAAPQPLTNETHDIWLVLDGEVLNHRALRHSLELVGHRFRSGADAEVALHAYEQWGLDFPQHLHGAFALALWDDRRDRLVLVRDRLGHKPLFVAEHRGCLGFASDIAALLDELALPRRIDAGALAHFLAAGTVPAPATLVAGVTKLGAGEMLVADRHTPPHRRRWHALVPDGRRARAVRTLPAERHAGNLRTLLECAVADRLLGNARLGVWLTPAATSGALAAIVTRLTGAAPAAVMVTDSSDSAAAADMRALARAAAIDVTEHVVDAAALALALTDMVARLPEPVAAPSLATGWFAAAVLGQQRSGALLADTGAAEIMLTHPAYDGWRHSRWRRLLASLRRHRNPGRSEMPLLGSAPAQVLAADLPPAGAGMDAPPEWMADDPLATVGLADLRLRLADGVAPGLDALAQAHGMEARLPFLDDGLIDYALAIPGPLRAPAGAPLRLLTRVLGDLAPAATLRGSPALPLSAWLAGPLGEVVVERTARWPLLDPGGMAALLAEHRRTPVHGRALWGLLVLAEWCTRLGLDHLAEAGSRSEFVHSRS
jgi:asparagine synthase (glutamine-hydrolysing)